MNMEPTNGGLENDVPFQFGHFQVPAVHLGFFLLQASKKRGFEKSEIIRP